MFIGLVATAFAAKTVFNALFERFKLRREFVEQFEVAVLFDDMMHEPHGEDKFFGVFVFFEQACFAGALDHGIKVVMASEIEIYHFGHFAVRCLNDIHIIRFLIHNVV